FFFSSRRRHTRCYRDWSSDVCSSDLGTATPLGFVLQALARWIHFLGIALTFGIIAYEVVTRREPRLRRLAVIGVVLLIAAEPVEIGRASCRESGEKEVGGVRCDRNI